MALMLVLAVMALLLILGVMIITLSVSENRSSKTELDLLLVRQLHDTGVNLSISQLKIGMQQVTEVEGREMWVSQPGALRTFKENGDFLRGIKLFSDDAMVVLSETELVNDTPPRDWNSDANADQFVDLNEPVIRGEHAFFPIVDPGAIETGVQGFDFEEAAVSGAVKTGSLKDLRLPMPVRWLYVLEDGTVGTLGPDGTFIGPVSPSKSNPITGRVAFWVDDESTKININTAAEPTPWDTPRAISQDDMSYGISQPARNEYQRYPGHPATTALSAALIPEDEITPFMKEVIYDRVPRIVGGGTYGGTRRPNQILQPDGDRLFATVDEFLFSTDRALIEDPDVVRRLRFFLTSNSRSPELNPRGHPKVGIWPLGKEGIYPRTAYDHLVAFCSTVGGELYAFQRNDPKSATADWDNIPRNKLIYEYLIRELSEKVPGYGGDYSEKWEGDLPQVTTQIFDYIRAANLREKTVGVSKGGATTKPKIFAGNGQVVPIRIGEKDSETLGFGRFFTMTEFGLHFICNGHGEEGLKPEAGERPLEPNERLVQASFLMEPFSASHGWPALVNDFTVRVTGLDSFKIGDKPLEFPAESKLRPGNLGSSWHGRNWGGPMGVRTFIGNRGNNYPFLSKRVRVDGESMDFKGGDLTVEIFAGNSTDESKLVQTILLTFPSSDFPTPDLVREGTIRFRGGSGTNKEYWWDFGKRYSQTTRVPHAPGEEYSSRKRQWPKDRSGNKPGFKIGGVFRAEDVVRTLTPYHSDNRLVAARPVVDASVFLPSPNYVRNVKIDHHFNDTQGTHLLYGFGNEPGITSIPRPTEQLTPATYHYSRLPDVRPGTGALNLFGDFDNGVAQIHDGAYINRPDEGNVATRGQYAYFAWNYKVPTEVNFSPNRMMPSPGMFGSLPTGVKRNLPWQTLLFRPQEGHPGAESPPDHALMEYFWMPVIEPYAISEPFSTAGKINLNYQILPFRYIHRSTGLHAVMKSERPLAIPNRLSQSYKLWDHETSDHPWLPNQPRGNHDNNTLTQWNNLASGLEKIRKPIDVDSTLEQFERKFDSSTIFKFPSEICDIHLVREGESLPDYESGDFQRNHVVTGDNTRERPYTNLYPRLTTRSNTYRIYVWAEALNQSRDSDPKTFDPATDTVATQFRGSTLIERYINPNDPDLPDFAEPSPDSERTLDDYFQFRILESSRFAP